MITIGLFLLFEDERRVWNDGKAEDKSEHYRYKCDLYGQCYLLIAITERDERFQSFK